MKSECAMHPCDYSGARYEDRPLRFGDDGCQAGKWCQWDGRCWDDAPRDSKCGLKAIGGALVDMPRTGGFVRIEGAPKHSWMYGCNGHIHFVSFAGFNDGGELWAHTECTVCRRNWGVTNSDMQYLKGCPPPRRSEVNWPECYIPEECPE